MKSHMTFTHVTFNLTFDQLFKVKYIKCDYLSLILVILGTKRKTFAHRAFSCAGPRLWNKLPRVIRDAQNENMFKNTLKQHLFENAYSQYYS